MQDRQFVGSVRHVTQGEVHLRHIPSELPETNKYPSAQIVHNSTSTHYLQLFEQAIQALLLRKYPLEHIAHPESVLLHCRQLGKLLQAKHLDPFKK